MNSLTGEAISVGGTDLAGPGPHLVGGPLVTEDVAMDFTVDDATWKVGIDYNGVSDRPWKIARTSFGAGDVLAIDGATGDVTLGGQTYNGVGTRVLQHDNDGVISSVVASVGDVVAPASATDNAICRYDTTTGKLIQNSGVVIDDSNNLSGINDITLTGCVDGIDVAAFATITVLNSGVSTDNAITRFDGPSGKSLQNSGVIIDDSDNLSGVGNITSTGTSTLNGDVDIRDGVLDISEATSAAATSIGAEFALQKFSGYDGSSFDTGALIRCTASQTWNGATRGTVMDFRTNASGETDALGSSRMQIDATGDVYVQQDLTTFGDFNVTGNILPATSSVKIGTSAGILTSGAHNISIGDLANETAGTQSSTIAIGNKALQVLTTGAGNIAIGVNSSRFTEDTGTGSNICLGANTLEQNISGKGNVALGLNSLLATHNDNNTGFGNNSGITNNEGTNNVFLGDGANSTTSSHSNQTAVGSGAICDAAQQCTIGNTSISCIRPGSHAICDLGQNSKRFDDLYLNGDVISYLSTPASASDTGTTGTIRYDASYIYICTGTNTWKRVAISTW